MRSARAQTEQPKSIFYLSVCICIFIFFSLARLLLDKFVFHTQLPASVYAWIFFWLFFSMAFSFLSLYEFKVGFLLEVFGLLIAWRILELHGIVSVSIVLGCVFSFQLTQLAIVIRHSLKKSNAQNIQGLISHWQLAFIRMYIGFDFIPHFTEKLFAGSAVHMIDVKAFVALGIPYPNFFVWLAGCCEFAAALSISSGFLLRIGALGATLYLLIATYLGNHFLLGFIWVNHGGGWEFAVMWAVIILSFALTGEHFFSLDEWTASRVKTIR